MPDDLVEQLRRTNAALADLRTEAGSDASGALARALEQLSVTLEELEVTSEELHAQNRELLEVHQELAEQQRAYRELFDDAPDPYVVTDVDGVVRLANEAACALLGLGADRLVGKPIAVFVPTEDRASFRGRLAQVPDDPNLVPWEFTVLPRRGQPVRMAADLGVERGVDGRATRLRWQLRDVTDARVAQQEAQEALSASSADVERLEDLGEMKDTFLAAAAHDLRSPLAVLIGSADTILAHPDLGRDVVIDMVGRMSAQARQLDHLVADLLDLERFGRGGVQAERKPTDVRALVDRVVERQAVDSHPVTVRGGGPAVAIDPMRVEQIVTNLLANAVRHTKPGTPIEITVTAVPGSVVLVVEDQGPGVPAAVRETLFEPFTSEGTGDTVTLRSGIGLSLVDVFSRLHGGHARVEDRPGGGARFVVELPGVG